MLKEVDVAKRWERNQGVSASRCRGVSRQPDKRKEVLAMNCYVVKEFGTDRVMD
jgi:hypothetical protein